MRFIATSCQGHGEAVGCSETDSTINQNSVDALAFQFVGDVEAPATGA